MSFPICGKLLVQLGCGVQFVKFPRFASFSQSHFFLGEKFEANFPKFPCFEVRCAANSVLGSLKWNDDVPMLIYLRLQASKAACIMLPDFNPFLLFVCFLIRTWSTDRRTKSCICSSVHIWGLIQWIIITRDSQSPLLRDGSDTPSKTTTPNKWPFFHLFASWVPNSRDFEGYCAGVNGLGASERIACDPEENACWK